VVGIQKVLTRLAADLTELRCRWALVGGLAVSVRAEPRTTRDVDVTVSVSSDTEAERLVAELRSRGYAIETLLEQENTGRLATVRLLAPGEEPGGIITDLLFASSGIEPEVVEEAELLEVLPDLAAPVATVAHLLALKVLAARTKDLADVENLLQEATPEDIEAARDSMRLITERDCARDKNLLASWARILEEHRPALLDIDELTKDTDTK